jgi:acetyl-CoA carboxylase carboxyltransferase component
MGPWGATNILYRKEIAQAEDPEAERKRLEDEYRERYLTPYAAARAGYIDDVIEPAKTRPMIIKALDAIQQKSQQRPSRKHGNMPV